jgi:hypothetical protein
MDNVLRVVERSNQRGGRMLSIVDLVEAETLTIAQASWLLSRIVEGRSWLVGAVPGGAGKTTIMSALLTMLPESETVRVTNPGTGWERSKTGDCVVSYEISPGPYDAYIWGADVVRVSELGMNGCRIVSNLHADTLEQAHRQIVEECGASEDGFAAFDMFLPILIDQDFQRRVENIQFCREGEWVPITQEPELGDAERAMKGFVDRCLAEGARDCSDVRARWCAFLRDRD